MKNNFKIVLNVNRVGYEYTKESIKTIKIFNAVSNQVANPSYGLISQSANISLVDEDKTIYNLLNDNSVSRFSIDIYLNNNLIGHYVADKSSIKVASSNINLELKDDLMKLQRFKNQEFFLGEDVSVLNIVNTLFSGTKLIIGNYNLKIDGQTQAFLSSIKLPFGYLTTDSFWNSWNKICSIGLLKIYIHKNNFVIKRIV